MSQDNKDLALAINLTEAPATVLLQASDLAAILQEVQSLRVIVKEHEMRLDKHGEYIRELRFKEEPEPSPKQQDRRELLRGLLIVNGGKMFASDARKRMGMDKATFSRLLTKMGDIIEVKKFSANKKKNLLILRSENG